jgi:hypothetical protein
MLTLCQLEGSVAIRPPQSPQLKRFTFFTSNARDCDGGKQVCLHMGYFETLADAQGLLGAVRRRFPHAIASRALALAQSSPEARALRPTEPPPGAPARQSFAPVTNESLTDTQVMRILETRNVATSSQNTAGQSSSAQVGLLRPEDTSVRRVLKEAVAQGAPVFFAVQLDWSAQPINLGRVQPLPQFKTHTVYATESRREGRCRYFLRLGFFADAASAKEAAFSVRSKFASAVVVPVTEEEITRAHEASTDSIGFSHGYLRTDQPLDRSGTSRPEPEQQPEPRSPANRLGRIPRTTETLEQTLATLAEQEMWTDPDSLSETGVRHLKVEVLEREAGGS